MPESQARRKPPSACARICSPTPVATPAAHDLTVSVVEPVPSGALGTLPSDRADLASFLGAMEELFELQDLLRRAHVLGVVDRSRNAHRPMRSISTERSTVP